MTPNYQNLYLYSISKSLFYFEQIVNNHQSNYSTFLQTHFVEHSQSLSEIDKNFSPIHQRIIHFTSGTSSNVNETKNNNLTLFNIFDIISNKENPFAYSHQILSPQLTPPTNTPHSSQLPALYQQFFKDLQQIQTTNPLILAENTLTLIQKYFSFTSTFLHSANCVSFYNHTKITAGFFTSFITSHQNGLIMLGGDVSGIQSFIYDIVNKQASKNLKGRSFYLQLVVDAITDYILQNTLPIASNIIYSSGGSFFLILPDTKDTIDKLNQSIIPYIQKQLYSLHKTTFSVPITYISFNPLNTETSNTSLFWNQLMNKIAELKRAPFKHFLSTHYQDLFIESEPGGYVVQDDFSGEDLEPDKAFIFTSENTFKKFDPNQPTNPDDLIISEQHKNILTLGQNLRQTNYIIKLHQPSRNSFNICNLLNIQLAQTVPSSTDNIRQIQILNPSDNNNFQTNLPDIHQSFYFYGGNDYPHDEQNNIIKDFEELATKTNSTFKRLGILRMDVDNLGSIFSEGLPSFSHYSTLSYFLDIFFKYSINTLWKQNTDTLSRTTIIYSGGDDLFILGQWNTIIQFANLIQSSFKSWTNGSLTLSAGISIVRPKFPILKAALMAGDEEELAKNHTYKNTSKNAISFFQQPLSFDTEFPLIKKLKDEIFHLLENNHLTKSTIYKLYTYKEMKNNYNTIQKHQWKWLIAYDFARNKNEHNKNFLDQVLQNTITNQNHQSKYHYLDLLCFAARWAELENR